MTHALVLIGGLLAGVAVALLLVSRRHEPARVHRILFPYVGLSALDAALRIARAEHATLVPAQLVTVPMSMPLQAPIDCGPAFALQEELEQRAASAGIPVDARIGPGRTIRHALRGLLGGERYDRIVVSAGSGGLSPPDVAWLLEHAPGEVVVLRPAVSVRAAPASSRRG